MALASQTVRNQPSPRSSVAYKRSRGVGGGGGGFGMRQKRVVGIVLLAGLCIGMTYWAVRQRDGTNPAGPSTPLAGESSHPTGPGSGERLMSANPMGSGAPVTREPAANTNAPAMTMGTNPALTQAAPPINVPVSPASSTPTSTPSPAAVNPAPTPAPAGDANAPRDPLAGGSHTAPPPALEPGLAASSSPLGAATAAADRAMSQGRPLEARTVLNRALLDPRTSEGDRAALRRRLGDLNQTLVFGPAQTPGDPFSETYRVVSGDNLTKITRKLQLITEPTLVARVNRLANPSALRVGQTLKVLRGPFHAVVSKNAYRMDIYAGPTPPPTSIGTNTSTAGGAEPGWTYICSFPVGLGEKGLTPIGAFTVKENSKLVNPHWVNPRTGEKFAADDPKNPIGERWLGLEGLDDQSRSYTGYGIHGTIDAGSIGHEMSMGCVRMNTGDVEQVYELLTSRVSVVKIVP